MSKQARNPERLAASSTRRSAARRRRLSFLRSLARLPAHLLILCVRAYQKTLGLFLGGRCRFYPSCSEYFIQAVEKYGAIKGTLRGTWRILRCHPYSRGGYDPP